MLVPALIYSSWRHSTKKTVCAKCGSPNVVPLDTPAGREIEKKFREFTSEFSPPSESPPADERSMAKLTKDPKAPARKPQDAFEDPVEKWARERDKSNR